MHKSLLFSLFFLSTLLIGNISYADCTHSTGRTENCYPTFRLTLSPDVGSNDWAVFFLAEAGQNNFRFNGTYGLCLNSCNRFKIGGEFLAQRAAYNFMNGKTHRWRQQWAGGIGYQWLLPSDYMPSLELGFEYANARRYKLPAHVCSNNQSVYRRLSGGVYYDFSAGLNVQPWEGAKLYLAVNYDSLKYTCKYQNNKEVRGFGGSFLFIQLVTEEISFTLKGQTLRPYDFLEGKLNWNSYNSYFDYTVSIFGNRTWGKRNLGNVSAFGIEVGFDLAERNYAQPDCRNYYGDKVYYWNSPSTPHSNNLAEWVSIPAVYIPEILSIADQSKPCKAPTSTSIPSQYLDNAQTTTFNLELSKFFTANGPALTYSATVTSSNPSGPLYSYFSADPATGYIILIDDSGQTGNGETLTITATGSNTCGSTSQTFTVLVF